jgi:16S rRNA (adenine1518-N6/adenine1519-N6)-dimethyltransferase
VVERLVASPGSRAYGALSVLTALRAQASFGFVVPPRAFSPPPEVDSAVVRLDMIIPPLVSLERFRQVRWVVRAAFSQRRKTLKNSLGAACVNGALADEALKRAGLDGQRRAETLTLAEFLTLTDGFGDSGPWQTPVEGEPDA